MSWGPRYLGHHLSRLAFLAFALRAMPTRAEPVTYSISVGYNQPPQEETSLGPLRFADDDAIRYHQLFRRLPGDSWLLSSLDADTKRRYPELAKSALPPSAAQLRALVAHIAERARADHARGDTPSVFVTYSGHGATSQEAGYYLTLSGSALTQTALFDDILAPLRDAQVHLIIDACHAGGVVGARGTFDHELDGGTVQLNSEQKTSLKEAWPLQRFPNVGLLVAAAEGQEAHEWSRVEAGVFTYEVASALLGAADINGDLKIEYSEVEAFVANANAQVKNPRAVPHLIARAPQGAAHQVLLDLSRLRETLFLTGDPNNLGRFHIELSNGQRWLDAHLPPSANMALALPFQAGTFLRASGREAEVPAAASGIVELDELRFAPLALTARGSIDRSLQSSLFRAPFDQRFYQTYVAEHALPSVAWDAPRRMPVKPTPDEANDTGPALLLGLSGLFSAAALTTAVLSTKAHLEFQNEERQRPAKELKDEAVLYRNLALATAGAAVATGVSAWLTWEWQGEGPRTAVSARGLSVDFSHHW